MKFFSLLFDFIKLGYYHFVKMAFYLRYYFQQLNYSEKEFPIETHTSLLKACSLFKTFHLFLT